MKNVISFIVCFVLLTADTVFAKGNFQLGYSNNFNTNVESVDVAAEANFKDEDNSMKIKYFLNKEQEEAKLKTLRTRTDLNLRHHWTTLYGFLGYGYERNLEVSLLDKTMVGTGVGLESDLNVEVVYDLYSGIYISSKSTVEDSTKGKMGRIVGSLKFPISKTFALCEDGFFDLELEKNQLKDIADYAFGCDTAIKAKLNEKMFCIAGYDYRYDNKPSKEKDKDQRQMYIRLGFDFN